MQTSPEGIQLIKSFESCRLKAYQDQVGVWTIGYGHTGDDVYEGQAITQDDADTLFASDLKEREDAVSRMVSVPLTAGQFSAIVSFVYNLGAHTLQTSTLLKDVNAGNFDAAAAQFPLWDHCGGATNPGLLRRRLAEQALFQSTDSSGDNTNG